MKPYDVNFVVQEIQEYDSLINEHVCGNYKIKKEKNFEKNLQGYMYENKLKYDIPEIELLKDNNTLMSLSIKEIESSYEIIKFARGKVGIIGLGLGYVVQKIAKKPKVKEVIVYEISEEIIEMYKSNFGEDSKIKIIHGDAFKAQRDSFDFFYVDIYNYKLDLNVVQDYKKLNDLHDIMDYSFWGMEHFLLSCKYEDIIWVYIPEMWVEMSKHLYTSLDGSGYIKTYKQLNEEKVREILLAFKEVLNEGM